jgi:uncharacterized membrane protein
MFALCHQLPHRSFLWLWDPPLLCARCTGFYIAIAIAVAVFVMRPDWARRFGLSAVAAGLGAMAVIAAEKLLDLEFGNWGRCLTAMPLGFAAGLGLAMPFVSRHFQVQEESK